MSSGALRSSGLFAAFATAFEHRVLRFPAVYLLIPASSALGKNLAGTSVHEARILVDGEGFEPS
jgi:hypothetical protein